MKIYHMSNHTPSQMMGFIIRTGNAVIAVDGGRDGDTEEFRRIVAAEGNHIDLWILTHPHADHIHVFHEVCKEPQGITVDKVWYSPVSRAWTEAHELIFIADHDLFLAAEKICPFPMEIPERGSVHTVGNCTIDVLYTADESVSKGGLNNMSLVTKLTEGDFSLLLLGDLGVRGGQIMLEQFPDRIKCTAVQMAHHGQNGCDFPVYRATGAKYFIFCAPDWLWSNTPPGAPEGSGPWQTLVVRGWVEELGGTPLTAIDETKVYEF